MTADRENAGAADQQTELEEPAGVSELDLRERLSVRFENKRTIKWLSPIKKDWHGVKNWKIVISHEFRTSNIKVTRNA